MKVCFLELAHINEQKSVDFSRLQDEVFFGLCNQFIWVYLEWRQFLSWVIVSGITKNQNWWHLQTEKPYDLSGPTNFIKISHLINDFTWKVKVTTWIDPRTTKFNFLDLNNEAEQNTKSVGVDRNLFGDAKWTTLLLYEQKHDIATYLFMSWVTMY